MISLIIEFTKQKIQYHDNKQTKKNKSFEKYVGAL
jgi:hypothetical protein